MKSKVSYKDRTKTLLNNIPFKSINIIIGIVFILSICITIFSHKPNYITIVTFLLFSISMGLYVIKNIIDDLEKVMVIIVMAIFFIVTIGMIGKFFVYFSNKYFLQDKNNMFQFYMYSFTTMIAALLGIVGTYFGADYSAKKSSEAIERQINKQEEYNKEQQEKDRKTIIRIITKFLKEEIIDNKKTIESQNMYNRFKKGFKTKNTYDLKDAIKFNDYNKVKYELIKYTNEKLVEDVIDVYSMFHILIRYDDINKYSKKEYSKISNLKSKINNLLNEIDKNY